MRIRKPDRHPGLARYHRQGRRIQRSRGPAVRYRQLPSGLHRRRVCFLAAALFMGAERASHQDAKSRHATPRLDRPEFLGGCDLWESWDS